MASGRYIDMEKEQRNKKAHEADSLKTEASNKKVEDKKSSAKPNPYLEMMKKNHKKNIKNAKDL